MCQSLPLHLGEGEARAYLWGSGRRCLTLGLGWEALQGLLVSLSLAHRRAPTLTLGWHCGLCLVVFVTIYCNCIVPNY